MDLTQWEKRNPRRGSDETNQAWERELEDDERMRDAPPPPPRSRTNSLSNSSDGDAAPREAVELCGICMLIEHMMANPPPGAAEPDGGWSHCSTGEAANFTNWIVFSGGYSEPDNWEEQAGGVLRVEDCTEILGGTQGLGDWRCDGRVSCLCERGVATSSPEYLSAMEAQRAALEAQATHARTWTLLTFVVIIPILWLLPGLLYLVTRCIASAYHATPAAVAPPEAPHKIGDESSAPVGPRSLVRRPSEMASAAHLVAAEKADRALRARVSGTAFYVGYILLVISLTPGTMFFLGVDLTATAGSFVFTRPASRGA